MSGSVTGKEKHISISVPGFAEKFGFVKELLNELSFDVFKPFLTA
jgi:hypothetical protein